ncbi:MAG TPA: M14 family metallopeptidase [Candidatus Methylomirabilis sp.]|nr:M14 family metallopeptidase [Candidatus Methylomirabilis sp.]
MGEREIKVGEATAAPGRVARGLIRAGVGTAAAVEMPVVVINGARPGRTVCVTGGVHGAEYPGIEAAIRLSRTLTPEAVRGAVIVIPIVSVPAFQRRAIYVNPMDGVNINRVFPGNPAGTITEVMAATLFREAVSQADALIDLHGGDLVEDLVPFSLYYQSGNPAVDDVSRKMAEVYGIKYIVRSLAIRGGSYQAAAAMGKPAILTESGGQGILDEPSTQVHVRGVTNVLKHLGVLEGKPEGAETPVHVSQSAWLAAEQGGMFYPAVAVGQRVEKGQVVGEFRDWFGEPVARVESPAGGIVLFLVTSPAINKGDPILSVGVLP